MLPHSVFIYRLIYKQTTCPDITNDWSFVFKKRLSPLLKITFSSTFFFLSDEQRFPKTQCFQILYAKYYSKYDRYLDMVSLPRILVHV